MAEDITLYMDEGEFTGWGWEHPERGHMWMIIRDDEIAEFDAWLRARGQWEDDDLQEVEMDDDLVMELRIRWFDPKGLHDGMGNKIDP